MTYEKNTALSYIEVNPCTSAKHCMIWLHGLGADGSDFAALPSELKLPSSASLRFIFPNAPIMPVTLNNGYEMRAWFDIYGLTRDSKVDTAGVAKAIVAINQLIEQEIARGMPSQHIFLGGFSQGAALALAAGLAFAKPLAGIVALSGFLPATEKVLLHRAPANQQTPIFMAHGTEDTIVAYTLGLETYHALKETGYAVTWHTYAMPHSVCDQELQDISKWLERIMVS